VICLDAIRDPSITNVIDCVKMFKWSQVKKLLEKMFIEKLFKILNKIRVYIFVNLEIH